MSDNKDILLDELANLERISARSVNICQFNSLFSLKEIINYYKKYSGFKTIRSCGVKSEAELIAICEKYKDQIQADEVAEPIKKTDSFLETINAFTPFQKATLNKHFEYLISYLTVRSFNGIASISESLNSKEIFEKIFSEEFNFKDIRNIGNKSMEELEKLKLELIQFIKVLRKIKKGQLNKKYTKLILKTTFNNLPDNFEKQLGNVFDEGGKIKLFTLLDFLIDSGQLFNEAQLKVFELTCTNDVLKHKIPDSIAKDLNISKERVRQIKFQLEEEIQSYFLFVSDLIANDLVNYNIDSSKTLLTLDKSFANRINESEGVNFNFTFYSIIFGVFLKNTHTFLGDKNVISGKRKTKNQKKYTNCYLINTQLFECFDFEKLVEDVFIKLNERIIETYSLNLKGYMYEFIKEDGKVFFEEIYSVCKALLFSEFELLVNPFGYLIFEMNTYKHLHKYCFEILDEFSRPMTVDEIEKAFNEKYPSIKRTTHSIRSSLIREKNLFISFRRSSTYALRKWEKEKENLKGGTIRDVEEFLQKEDSPYGARLSIV